MIVKLIKGQRNPLWYVVIALLVGPLLTMGVMWNVNQRQIHKAEERIRAEEQQNDRRWCTLLIQLDNTLPSTSLIGPIIHTMRNQFGCNVVPPLPLPSDKSSPSPTGR